MGWSEGFFRWVRSQRHRPTGGVWKFDLQQQRNTCTRTPILSSFPFFFAAIPKVWVLSLCLSLSPSASSFGRFVLFAPPPDMMYQHFCRPFPLSTHPTRTNSLPSKLTCSNTAMPLSHTPKRDRLSIRGGAELPFRPFDELILSYMGWVPKKYVKGKERKREAVLSEDGGAEWRVIQWIRKHGKGGMKTDGRKKERGESQGGNVLAPSHLRFVTSDTYVRPVVGDVERMEGGREPKKKKKTAQKQNNKKVFLIGSLERGRGIACIGSIRTKRGSPGRPRFVTWATRRALRQLHFHRNPRENEPKTKQKRNVEVDCLTSRRLCRYADHRVI